MILLDAAPVIKRIVLPRLWKGRPASLRRSWLVNAASQSVPPESFIDLLREFCPRLYRNMPAHQRTQFNCYIALLNNLPFPVHPWAVEHAQQCNGGYGDDGYWWWDGVPIDPQGFDDEGGYMNGEGYTLPVQMIWLIASSTIYDLQAGVQVRTQRSSLDTYKRAPSTLKAKLDGAALAECVREGLPEDRPWLRESPAGRAWREPWQHLDMLVRWVQNDTGWGWLDETTLNLEECACYPPWDADEITALIENWRECEPIQNGIGKLSKYIEEGWQTRLTLMTRVIHGDTDAILQVTQFT